MFRAEAVQEHTHTSESFAEMDAVGAARTGQETAVERPSWPSFAKSWLMLQVLARAGLCGVSRFERAGAVRIREPHLKRTRTIKSPVILEMCTKPTYRQVLLLVLLPPALQAAAEAVARAERAASLDALRNGNVAPGVPRLVDLRTAQQVR